MSEGHATQSVAIDILAYARLRDAIRRQGFGWQAIPQLHSTKFSFKPIIDKLNCWFFC